MANKIKIYRKKPEIAYASSTIQQNFGEEINKHGILKWDLNSNTHEFIQIPNDVGYYTINIENNNFPGKELKLSRYPHIRLIVKNTSSTKLEKFILKLKSEYEIKSISIIKSAEDEVHTNKHGMSILGDINSTEYQNSLINQYLSLHSNNIKDSDLDSVALINKEMNAKLSSADKLPSNQWKIKELWFSNMFCFGENNYINFETLQGVYGLYSQNKTGKSSILDIILFLLFDKSSRASKGIDFLNIDKNEFSCKIRFELNGLDYFIEKTATRTPTRKKVTDKCPVKTNFWSYDPITDDTQNLNGDQRRSTNQSIQDLIGVYDNIALTAISLQNNNSGLIEKSQAERKSILSAFLGIDVFEQLHQFANVELKKINAIISEYKKQNLDDAAFSTELEFKRLSKEIDILETILSELDDKKENLTSQIINLNTDIQKINIDADISVLERNKTASEALIIKLNTELETTKEKLKEYLAAAKKISSKISSYNTDECNTKLKKLQELRIYKQSLENQISLLKLNIKNQKDKLEKLDNLEYDPNCTYCMNNIFVKDAIDTKQKYNINKEEFTKLNKELSEINIEIDNSSQVETLISEHNKILVYKDKLKLLYANTSTTLNNITDKIKFEKTAKKHIDKDIQSYYDNQLIIENNQRLKSKIETLTLDLDVCKKEFRQKNDSVNILKSNLQQLVTKKSQISENLIKMQEYETIATSYEYYIKATSRDGIQYELIKKILPVFEQEINNILSQIVDFKILIYIDDKNIEMNIVYSDKTWPLKLTSGMEKFISSIAIRVALTKIANIAKPNFLIIDEGMGNLDSDNLSSIPVLFNYLKSEFDFVFVISHLAIMRDMTDKLIEIDSFTVGSSHVFVK